MLLDADDYGLEALEIGEGVQIEVLAGPEACEECLVPKPLFTSLVLSSLSEAGIELPADRLHLRSPADPP